jgi:FtsX-like permease family
MFRRVGAAFRLAFVRVASRPGRVLFTAAGIAAAVAALVGLQVATRIAQDRDVVDRVAALPPEVKAIRLDSYTVAGQSESYTELDRLARTTLSPLLGRAPIATVLFRESTIGGKYLGIGGVDGLRRWVTLRSGRYPRRCGPARCEVVQIRGRGGIPNVPGLRLVPVGRGDLRTSTLYGDAVAPAVNGRAAASLSESFQRSARYHLPAPPPIVLAEGAGPLIALPLLQQEFRTYSWVVPIERGDVRVWSVRSLTREIDRARSQAQAESGSFELRAPIDELADASEAATVAGRRLALVAGEVVALLLAFGLVAASQTRRDVDSATRRLVWLGTPRWLSFTAVAAEVVLVIVAAAVVGWVLGAAFGAIAADAAGEPVGPILLHSVLAPTAVGVGLGALLITTSALLLVLKARRFEIPGASLSLLDVAALAAAAAVAAILLRGRTDTAAIVAERGTGFALLLLPGLIAALFAVAVVRLFPLAVRLARRVLPLRAAGGQVAALSLLRSPARPATTVAFIAVSLGLAIFAASYGSTLSRGHRDQARFATGADFVLREDPSRLVPVPRVVREDTLDELGSGAEADLIVRLSGSAPGARDVTGIAVVGLDRQPLLSVDGWRNDFASVPLPVLASRLRPDRALEPVAVELPPKAGRIAIRVTAQGRPIGVSAVLRDAKGQVESVRLGSLPLSGRSELGAPLRLQAPAQLLALRFDPPTRLVERGADAGGVARSSVTLEAVRVTTLKRTVGVTRYSGWVGLGGARRRGANGRLLVTVTDAVRSYFRPRQPTDGQPLPLLVSPRLARLAADDGRLPLDAAGTRIIGKVVGTARRFPTTTQGTFSGDFAVADKSALLTTLNAADPGTGQPNELWVEAPPPASRDDLARRLRQAPFDALATVDQHELEARLSGNPVARAAHVMLVVAAVVAALLAFLGLALGVLAELRDERGELHDLETQGFRPSQLRRQIQIRAAVLVLLGVAAAVALAAALSMILIDIVAVTATAGDPEPPLLLTVDWPEVTAIVVAALAASSCFVVLASWSAFRAPTAGRGGAVAG